MKLLKRKGFLPLSALTLNTEGRFVTRIRKKSKNFLK
nr:MAG TPA: hypothetical protein [Caudoviricetes sp.]